MKGSGKVSCLDQWALPFLLPSHSTSAMFVPGMEIPDPVFPWLFAFGFRGQTSYHFYREAWVGSVILSFVFLSCWTFWGLYDKCHNILFPHLLFYITHACPVGTDIHSVLHTHRGIVAPRNNPYSQHKHSLFHCKKSDWPCL